ncbi:MAG: porin family protein [Ferruginibacter sp.]
MKTVVLSVATFLFFASAANAQGIHAGVKLGANMNKISGQSFKDKFTYGYNAGAYLQVGLGKKWSIQPEVLFNQVSADTSDQFSALYHINGDKLSKVKLNYISIPILLNYKLSNFISLQAGPQFGMLMSQDKTLLQNGKDAFKQGDFSMVGGVQLTLVGVKLFGRYQVGLNNINDIDNKDKWKNQVIQLGVGFNLF